MISGKVEVVSKYIVLIGRVNAWSDRSPFDCPKQVQQNLQQVLTVRIYWENKITFFQSRKSKTTYSWILSSIEAERDLFNTNKEKQYQEPLSYKIKKLKKNNRTVKTAMTRLKQWEMVVDVISVMHVFVNIDINIIMRWYGILQNHEDKV